MKQQYPHTSVHRLNSKRANWKHALSLFAKLYNQPGFAYDEARGWFSAEPETWAALKAQGPPLDECCWFKSNPMPYKKELEEIFGTGSLAARRRVMDEEETREVESEVSPMPSQPQMMFEDQERDRSILHVDAEGLVTPYLPPTSSEASAISTHRQQQREKRRQKKQGMLQLQQLIRLLLEKLVEQNEERQKKTPRQLAVRHLMTEYPSILSRESMIKAIKVVSKEYDVFMALDRGLQEAWLMSEIRHT